MAESTLPGQAGQAGQAGGQSVESVTEMSALAASTFFALPWRPGGAQPS